MAKIPLNIQNIIDRYLFELKKSHISINQVYLFGSYAKGYFNEFSDIDIAVVSDQFTGNRIVDRDMIRQISLNVSYLFEIIPFKTNEFIKANPFANEILKTGIRIL